MRRDKHEGSYSRLANGRMRIRVMVNGKVFSHTADSKVELNKWRRELIMQIESGVRPRATRMTVSEAFAEWYEDYKTTVRRSSALNIASAIHMWAKMLPNEKLTHLNKDIVQSAVERGLASGYAPRSMSTRVTILGMMCNWAVDNGYILRSPTTGIKVTQTRSKVDRNVVDYAERIIAYLDDSDVINAARCRLLFYTGIRIGEACGLKWSDIDLDRQCMSISRQVFRGNLVEPKTHASYRTITIPDAAVEVFHSFDAMRKGDFVISTTTRPCSPCGVQDAVCCAGRKLGFTFKTHWFRHAHASYCLHHGMNIAALSARLGHSSISTTLNVYSHVLPGADDAVREMWAVKKVVKKVD